MTAVKFTDTERLDFVLSLLIIDEVDPEWEMSSAPQTIGVFDNELSVKLKPMSLRDDLRDVIDRAMEGER